MISSDEFADDLRAADLKEEKEREREQSARKRADVDLLCALSDLSSLPQAKTSKRSNPLARSLAHASPVTAPSCSPAVSREIAFVRGSTSENFSLSLSLVAGQGEDENGCRGCCGPWTPVSCVRASCFPFARSRFFFPSLDGPGP